MYRYLCLSACVLALTACQDTSEPTPNTQVATPAKPVEVVRTATKNAYFGDLHVHTRNSFDAFIFGTRATADQAYRFAQGDPLDNGAGHTIQLDGPPLDFYSVTDHGEYLGIVPALRDKKSHLSKTKVAKSIFGAVATDRRDSFLEIGRTVVSGEAIEEIYDQNYMNSVWAETVAATERHNAPGRFTTFAGYEFTSMIQITEDGAANLHRNVIFENEAPTQLFTTLNSPNPENLWTWMDAERANDRDVMAIPHNSNASNGMMFAQTKYEGGAITQDYANQRLRNEPLVEITQVKGTSETHLMLSPNDEWADFEQYEYLIGSETKSDVKSGSFVRGALARGLVLEAKVKTNPYEFGVIGSSDTHLGAPSLSEEHHFGKFSHDMDPVNRQSTPSKGAKSWSESEAAVSDLLTTSQYGASGLAGVWAEANTREDLFASMRARETFGTSGPRLRVRFFAANDFPADVLSSNAMVETAYDAGVPMGSEMASGGVSPKFLVWAAKDALSAPLQRVQIIKVMQSGETVYDVACSDGSKPDVKTQRCVDNGASVDLQSCALTGGGASELKTVWQDPTWRAGDSAAYYVRVLENPKCRWSTWDAVRNGTPPNPNMSATVQDRAWSSPIWVK
ncbi:MAG: DUF3604 domain-containing protein [Maricaulaceae bacterium]